MRSINEGINILKVAKRVGSYPQIRNRYCPERSVFRLLRQVWRRLGFFGSQKPDTKQ